MEKLPTMTSVGLMASVDCSYNVQKAPATQVARK